MNEMCNHTNCGGTYQVVDFPVGGGYRVECSRCKHEKIVSVHSFREAWSDPIILPPEGDGIEFEWVVEWHGPQPWDRAAVLSVHKDDEEVGCEAFVIFDRKPRGPSSMFFFDPHNEGDCAKAWRILMGQDTP